MSTQSLPDQLHRDAAPMRGAASPPPPVSYMTLDQVLDRLGPSIFAGLIDTDGVLRYANQAALRAISSTPEQVIGQRFDATPWWRACEPSRARLQQALASAMRGEASRFDVRVAAGNGDVLDMDFSLLPLYGPDGRVLWLIPSARDVSERQRAQDQLRLTRHAVEQSNDALMQVGPDGVLRDVNAAACRLLGMERERLLRMQVADIDAQLEPSQWAQRWRDLRELGSLRFETRVRHREGHEIPVDVSVSLVTSDEASFAHVCMDDLSERHAAEHRIRQQTRELRRTVEALHRQIAERERAEEALRTHRDDLERLVRERTAELRAAKDSAEAANDAKSHLLAAISDELRTPLNVILGFAQILGARHGLDERQQRAVRVIDDSGKHLLALVNDLLDLSKISAGRFDIRAAEFEPQRFFDSIIAMVRVRAEEKADIEFACDLPTTWPPSIRADETRLRRVLINLLDSAIKFTGHGRISLRARLQPPATLRIEVEDTGPTMTAEQLARLFRPFEQEGDARQRALGTGLGLVMSQHLVRLMGGALQVESRPGQGNLFWFELDVASALPVAAGEAADVEAGAVLAMPPVPAPALASLRTAELRTTELRAGHALAEHFISTEGVLLLSAGQQLDDDLIDRIRAYERKQRLALTLRVQWVQDAGPAHSPAQPNA